MRPRMWRPASRIIRSPSHRVIRLFDSPAEKAGLRGYTIVRRRYGPIIQEAIDRSTADLITAVDGKPVRSSEELLSNIEEKKPGEEVTISVVRNGRRMRLTVRLEADD